MVQFQASHRVILRIVGESQAKDEISTVFSAYVASAPPNVDRHVNTGGMGVLQPPIIFPIGKPESSRKI